MSIKKAAKISMWGLIALLVVIAFIGRVDFITLFLNMVAFVFGGLENVPNASEETLLTIVSTACALMLISIAFAYASAFISQAVAGDSKSYASETLDNILDKGSVPFFLLIAFEEVIARLIPLGLLTMVFKGELAFYILLVVGNVLWTLIHLLNYKDPKERDLVRLLPQFIAGLMLSYVFVRYGFWGALMVHYLYDVVLLSSRKEQSMTIADVFSGGYYAIVGIVSFQFLAMRDVHLSILQYWYHAVGSLDRLPGLTFWDYLLLILVIDSAVELLADLLMLDDIEITIDHFSPKLIAWTNLLYMLILFGLNWTLGFFISDILTKAIMITVVMTLLQNTTSGSMLARNWLTNLPTVFLFVATTTLLGFWAGLSILTIYTIIRAGSKLVRLFGPSKAVVMEIA